MKTLIGDCVLLSLAVTAVARAATELTIDIEVFNHAHVFLGLLTRAERASAGIFQRIGIEIEWHHCPLSVQEMAENTACAMPGAPTRFMLRLLPDDMARRFPFREDVFGFALVPSDGSFGVMFNVFTDRAAKIASGEELCGMMDGYLIAHELGHLLLKTTRHSLGGIMRGQWRKQDLVPIQEGRLSFLPQEEERIREQVRMRILAASDKPHAPGAVLRR